MISFPHVVSFALFSGNSEVPLLLSSSWVLPFQCRLCLKNIRVSEQCLTYIINNAKPETPIYLFWCWEEPAQPAQHLKTQNNYTLGIFYFIFQKQMDLLKVPITDPVCPGLVLLYIPSSAVTQSLYFGCLWSSAARPRDSRAPALWSSSVGSVCSSLSALPPFSRHLSHASPSARQAEHLSCTCVRASKQHIWHNVLLRMTVGWRNWE